MPTPLAYARAVKQTIEGDTQRTTWPMLRRLFPTILLPFAVFATGVVISSIARLWVEAQFNNGTLNFTTSMATALVTLALTWGAYRFSERRYGGFAALRGSFAVVGQVAKLESALARVEAGGDDSPAAVDALTTAADTAWTTYTDFLTALDMAAPPLVDEPET